MTDTVRFVDIDKIIVKDRTREDFGDMLGLIESIRDKGVIQPITLNSKLELKAGGRRYEASLQAGLRKIPCLIRDNADELDGMEIELIENIERKDFNWTEHARHIKRLQDYCLSKNIDWSGRKLAELLNKSTKTVARQLVLAGALEDMPELATLKTQDEAEKVLRKLQEEIVVKELRHRQDTQVKDKSLESFLHIAKANYQVEDCFKGMAQLTSGGMVHFIELDPPYAIDLGAAKKGADSKAKSYQEIAVKDYATFMDRMARETYRVANQHCWMICWFGPTHFHLVQTTLRKAGWSVGEIPALWVKPAGQTMAPEYNLANCYEPFFICRKGSPALFKRGRSNVFQYSPVAASVKYHPTQRPLDLMIEILETFAVLRQICLVPCLGSGTTLRACYIQGLSCFGFDISGEYRDKFLLAAQSDLKELNSEE